MKRKLIRSVLSLGVALAAIPLSNPVLAYQAEIKSIATKLAAQLEKAGQKSATVLDLTDLQGQGTELGRFLAQELSDQLVSASKTVSLVDRTNLQYLLRENKLSVEGLIDPSSSRKLGNMIGIDTVVLGTVTPIGQTVRLSIRAVAVETGKIVASQSTSFPSTTELSDLYPRGLAAASTKDASHPSAAPDVRARFRSDSLKISGRYVRYATYTAEGCTYGSGCATAAVVIENRSGIAFDAAIRRGSVAVGSCVHDDATVAGLNTYSSPDRFEPAKRYVSANAKIPLTITLVGCSLAQLATTDVSLALTISTGGRTFDIPLSVSNIPVQAIQPGPAYIIRQP